MSDEDTTRRCVLHVGTEKTGSTSIQTFLFLNRAALLEQGWLAPLALAPHAPAGPLNHIILNLAGRDDDMATDALDRACGATDREVRRKVVEWAAEQLRCEINATRPSANLVLSNEHIHSRLRSVERLIKLREFVQRFAQRIQIVVYIRAQYEMARAFANTALRNGSVVTRGVPLIKSSDQYFDLNGLVSRLSEVLGEESITVRLYPEVRHPQNDVVVDFADVLGLDASRLRFPQRENTSFDLLGTSFINEINERLRFADESSRWLVSDKITAFLSAKHRGKGVVASPQEIREFMAPFAAGNEAIRSKWFADREQLFDLDAGTPEAADPLTIDTLMDLFIEYLLSDQG
jgi:hypothetical protein